MDPVNIDIPKSWRKLDPSKLKGVVMIVGGTNTGKTTFSTYLFTELQRLGQKVAYIDGDPGQSKIGPPTTMTLQYSGKASSGREHPKIWRTFVGSTTPKGNMLQVLISARRLVDRGLRIGAHTIIYDSSGLIDPRQGGLALKLAKIDLLRPSVLIALQRENELNSLIMPYRKCKWLKFEIIKPSNHVRIRDVNERRVYRAAKFGEYLNSSSAMLLNWENYSIFPAPGFAINRLIALVDDYGFVSALGIILKVNWDDKSITIKVPRGAIRFTSIIMGNIFLDPDTFQDRLI